MTKSVSLDLASLAIQDCTVVHLTHPATGDKLFLDPVEKTQPMTITVASSASREYRQAVTAMNNRALNAQKRGKKVGAEDQREEGIELLTAVCRSAQNLILNGAAVKTEADFRAVLSNDSYSWIKNQVDSALGDVELFIGKSLTA